MFVLNLIVQPQPLFAQSESQDELAARIDAYASPFVEAGHLSGTLIVTRGDQVLYERSWGLANHQRKTNFQSSTPCCVASVSKPVTAIIAARLIEDGKLNLQDAISKWLPDFPKADQIQVQHLMFHRAGIPHRLTTPDDENVPRTAADMVTLAKKSEFDYEPGRGYKYSSGGYSVLVRVMELASGKSYQQLLNDVVIEPLRLKNTFHPGPRVDLSEAAKSYVWTVDGQTVAPEKDYSFLVGAGSLFSTPADMAKIANALVAGKFGDAAKRSLVRGGRLKWNGITNSYRAFLEYDSSTDVTVAMVANQMTGANDLLRQNVPRIVAGDDVAAPSVPNPKIVHLEDRLLASYAGRYNIGGSPMPVRARDGALYANEWILLPTSETSFFSPQDYGTVQIIQEDGKPTGLDWSGLKCDRLGDLNESGD